MSPHRIFDGDGAMHAAPARRVQWCIARLAGVMRLRAEGGPRVGMRTRWRLTRCAKFR